MGKTLQQVKSTPLAANNVLALLLAALNTSPEGVNTDVNGIHGQIDQQPTFPGQQTSALLLTLRQLSRETGISPTTLWRYRVPKHDLGGRPRYKLSEVLAYLESDQFKRRAAALRAERKRSKKAANRPTSAEGGAK